MGRDPKWGRVIKFWGRVTLVQSCCMVIINYFDTFNIEFLQSAEFFSFRLLSLVIPQFLNYYIIHI